MALYNKEQKCLQTKLTCLTCRFYDKTYKKCRGGLNKVCYLYDEKTGTVIDAVTKLPIKL